MSMPSYIINWEELLEILGDKLEIDINDIDLSDLENYLVEQFETIIDLLKQILELLKDKGVQRIHSISNHIPAVVAPFKFTTTFEEDVLITGITYSQSAWKYQDSWNLEVDGNLLFEEIGTKEIGESKAMNVFYYVPAGKPINIIFHNDSGNSRLVWFDIEYIDLSMSNYIPTPKPTGIIVVNYITEDRILIDSKTLTGIAYGSHIIKPEDIPGYSLVGPDRHSVRLSDIETTVTVEFIVKNEELPPINNPYDWLVVMRWEDGSSADIDLHCYFDCNSNKHVYYSERELVIDEENKAWLNYDYTRHGANGRQDEPEIISILGMNNYTSNIYITNYNKGTIEENVTIEIYKREDNKDVRIHTATIAPSQISEEKTIYVGNIKNGEFIVIKENVPYEQRNLNLSSCRV
ncbi:hypothetical protein [Tissierella sp.]|uniref:hypothetical protein n=1 Tax=Tissierella sp. TaxID=41274 RepID=UPI00302B339C